MNRVCSPNRSTYAHVRVEQVRPIIVAFVRHVGPYEQLLEKGSPMSALWDELFHWGNENNLINAASLLIGLPQDDPSVTPPEKQRFDVCVQIPEFRNPAGHIGCQTIVAGTFGVGRHYGSFDNLADTYLHVYDSLVTTGTIPASTPHTVRSVQLFARQGRHPHPFYGCVSAHRAN